MDFSSSFPMEDDKPEILSIKQLKDNLKETLEKSGVTGTIKSQIRKEFIKGLGSKSNQEAILQQQSLDIQEKILLSLIYHVFVSRKMVNSLSVFVPESGLNPKMSLVSEKDIKMLVKYNKISNDYDKFNSHKENQTPSNNSSTTDQPKKHTMLDYILQFCLNMNQNIQKEIAVQTDVIGPSIREFLDIQVTNLQTKYAERSAAESVKPSKSIEERMFIFQRECEARFNYDLKMQIAAVRENEMLKVRLEENAKCRLALEQQRQELEAEYNIRLQGHMDRETNSARRLADRERELERSHYDSRQLFQREIDDLRSRETLLSRKSEADAHSVKMLELRLKESEQILTHRERELARREKVLEDKTRDVYEVARKEAEARIMNELDSLSKDRHIFIVEKQRFEEEKSSHTAFMSNYAVIKDKLDKTLQELIGVQDELNAEKKAALRVAQLREEEDRQIAEVMKSVLVNSNLANANEHFTHIQHILLLIQQNAKLAADFAAVRDPRGLETLLKTAQSDLTKAQSALHTAQREAEIRENKLKVEINALQLQLAEESKQLATQLTALEQVKHQLTERNKTIEELSRLNNWQGGVEVKNKDWKAFGKTLIEENIKPTIPALGEDFYTQWLMDSTVGATRQVQHRENGAHLSTADSLFSVAKPAFVSSNPYNYPPGAWIPPVAQAPPAIHYASRENAPTVAEQWIPPTPQMAQQYYEVPPVNSVEPQPRLRPPVAPSPTTLNPPLITPSTYNPKQDPQSILYPDPTTIQYTPVNIVVAAPAVSPPVASAAEVVKPTPIVAPAPVSVSPPCAQVRVSPPITQSKSVDLPPTVDEEEAKIEAAYQLQLQQQREAKVAANKERQRLYAEAEEKARIRRQNEAIERQRVEAEELKKHALNDEARRRALSDERFEREKQEYADAMELEKRVAEEKQLLEKQRAAERQAEADRLEHLRVQKEADDAAAEKARREKERLAEIEAQERADAATAAEQERLRKVEEQQRMEREAAAKKEAEEKARNEFLEQEKLKRLEEQREREQAEAAARAEKLAEERRVAALKQKEEEDRLRREQEEREEQLRKEVEAKRLADEEKQREDAEKADTIRKAREEVIRRREAARNSTESLNSRSAVGSSVSSLGDRGGVTVSQSIEKMAGVRGSTTSAFSYGTNDSGSEGDSPNLDESEGGVDNTIEVNEISSDDSQDRSW